MNTSSARQRAFALGVPLVFLLIASLACLGGGAVDGGGPSAADLQATAAALAARATQQAQSPPPQKPAGEGESQPPAQQGGDASLTLINNSALDVCFVQISPTTSDTWGDDWLGAEEVIPSGTSRVFNLPAGIYDMRALDCDQAELGVQSGISVDGSIEWEFSGGGFYYDDFAVADPSAWESFDVPGYGFGGVVGGEYVLGPFEECADVGGSNPPPFACFSQCLACGVASAYDMSVNARYLDGLADRSFGIVLRFVDLNGDGLVDPGDYYLDFEINVYDRSFVVWEHDTSNNWTSVVDGTSNSIQTSRSSNNLRAVAYNGGSDIDLFVNGASVASVNVPYLEGTVGLAIGFRGVKVGYDDFTISGG